MSQHVIELYGTYFVLWSCIVFVIHGKILSLANAAIAVEINVYIATHHQMYQLSNFTPNNSVRSLGPIFKNGELSCIIMHVKTPHDIIVHAVNMHVRILLSSNINWRQIKIQRNKLISLFSKKNIFVVLLAYLM